MVAFVSRLSQIPTFKLILAMWVLVILCNVVLLGLLSVSIDLGMLDEEGLGGDFLESMSSAELVLIALVIAPILETLIFQGALLLFVKKLTEWVVRSDSWLPAFLITSLTFAAVHATNAGDARSIYGLLHAATRIPASIALTLLAVVQRTRRGGFPLLSVFVLHGLINLPLTLLYLPPE